MWTVALKMKTIQSEAKHKLSLTCNRFSYVIILPFLGFGIYMCAQWNSHTFYKILKVQNEAGVRTVSEIESCVSLIPMMYLILGRSLKMSSTQPGWMSPVEGTRVPCPSPSPAALWAARALALTPATDQALVPVHVRVHDSVKLLNPVPTCVNPVVPARVPATSQTSVKAPHSVLAQAHAQGLTKDPPLLLCPIVSCLKDLHLHLSQMLSTLLPPAFLLFLTSWAPCRCIPPECCWCATAAWPTSS